MKKFYTLFKVLLLALATSAAWAQQSACDENTTEARKLYATGNFDKVFELLKRCPEKDYSDRGRLRAYELLSMSYLAVDSMAQSTRVIGQLLTLNPKFEADDEAPPRYQALVEQVRESREQVVQVTSVSKRLEDLRDAPATIMVLTSRDIAQRGYQNLEQLLHDLPGFDVIKGNGPGYTYFYQRGYRSTSNDRTLLLIDGVEENDLASGNTIISRQYSLADIEQVEVIYGPASTLYGANAFSGVINITTKSFVNQPGPRIGFAGQARTGSLNTHYVDGVLTAKTKDLAVSITGRLFHSDEQDLSGYPEWDFGPRTAANYTGQLDKTGQDAAGNYLAQEYLDKSKLATRFPNSPLYTVDYAPGGTATALRLSPAGAQQAATLDNRVFGQTLNGQPVRYNDTTRDWLYRVKAEFKDFTFSYLNWKTDEGGTPWYNNRSTISAASNPRWVTHDRAFSLTYAKNVSDKFQLRNITSYLLHEIDGNSSLVNYNGYFNGRLGLLELAKDSVPQAVPTYYYRISTQLRNELRLFWSPNSRIDVSNGIELRSGLIQGNFITAAQPLPNETATLGGVLTQKGGNNFQTTDFSAYSQATYRLYQSATNTRTFLNLVSGLRADKNRIRTNGGYGTVFNPRLSVIYSIRQLVLKTTYAEAFKDATFFQKYFLADNPNLPPERVRNLEVSAYYQFTKQLSFNVVGYRSRYLETDISSTKVLEQLVDSRRIWGLQGEGSYKASPVNVWWNFTYTNPLDTKKDLRISDIANYAANAGADYQFRGRLEKLNLYGSVNYVSARKTGAGTSGSSNVATRFEPYCIFNSNLTYHDLLPGLDLQASVSNLLDTEYFLPGIREANDVLYASRYPQERRLFSLAVLYNLNSSR